VRIVRLLPAVALSAFAGTLIAAPAAGENLTGSAAVLQAMDKVTARISRIEAPIGQAVRYGELEIQVKSCRKRPPEEPPESAAFLEIFETKKGERRKVFGGWMFASSPALSAMEHPVYDVWVVDCTIGKAVAPNGAKKAAKKTLKTR
jgi:hypothetical protein